MSFRLRLTLACTLAVAIALAAASAATYLAVSGALRGHVDAALRSQAKRLVMVDRARALGFVVRLPPAQRGDAHVYVQFVDAEGTLHAPGVVDSSQGASAVPRCGPFGCEQGTRTGDDSLRVTDTTLAVLHGGGVRLEDQHVDGQHLRVLSVRLRSGAVAQMSLSLVGVDESIRRTRDAMTWIGAASVLLALLVGLAVTRIAVTPVRRLEQAVEAIDGDGDLSERIHDLRADEIGRLGRSFNRMLDRLSQSRAEQQRLVQDASHELRTPLTSILTNVEVLELADDLPERHRALVRDVAAQVGELSALTDDLVLLAEGNRPAAEDEDVVFGDLVAACVRRAERAARGMVTFVTNSVASEGRHVRGSAAAIESAVDNLLSNAVKFSPDGGTITLTVSDGALVVCDEGPGVPVDARPFVFDRFYRAVEARSTPGAGLGLSIVRKVADQNGGSIEVDSAPWGGARFTLRLPTVAGGPAPT
jgi:two-component system sensor histidine kinase MprB